MTKWIGCKIETFRDVALNKATPPKCYICKTSFLFILKESFREKKVGFLNSLTFIRYLNYFLKGLHEISIMSLNLCIFKPMSERG